MWRFFEIIVRMIIHSNKISKILGLASICVGVTIVVAWILDISALKSIIPNAVTMKFSTAVSFVFSGITVYFVAQYYDGKRGKAQIAVPVSGFVIFLFMATILLACIVGVNSGIEQLFVREAPNAVQTPDAGRPSIPTMTNFVLIVIAGIFALSETKLRKFVSLVGYAVSIIGAISIIGHITNQPLLYYYVDNVSAAMAIHTSILFVCLGIALVLLRKNNDVQTESIKIQTRMISLFLSVSLIPIIFIVGLSFNNIENTSDGESTKLSMIIIGIITAIAATIFSILTAKSISKPIVSLKDVSAQISKGNHSIKADESGNDEIGELSKTFNVMVNEVIKAEKLSTIGLLSSTLGHDLKNHITVMKMSLGILKNESQAMQNENVSEKISLLEKSTDKMWSQIEDVLNFIRQNPLQLETISFAKLLENALKIVKTPETIKLKIPTKDIPVYCDVKKLETVLVNLINNSIQAMDSNGIITIKSNVDDTYSIIQIEDSGPGMSPETLSKIFNPLFTTKRSGTGLGLASCKNIMEQHGGMITAQNNPTTFTIKIPKPLNS